MAFYLLQDYIRKNGVVDDFKSFIAHDGVLSVSSAVIIGISTVGFITCFVKDILLPSIYFIMVKWVHWVAPNIERGIGNVYGSTTFNFISFFQGLITWIFALISTYIVLEYFVRRTIIKKVKDQQEDQ